MRQIIIFIIIGIILGVVIAHAQTTVTPEVNGTFTQTTNSVVTCSFLNAEINGWQQEIANYNSMINSVNAEIVSAGCNAVVATPS